MSRIGVIFLVAAAGWACSPGNAYDKLEESELASGIRHDSLFMGLYLGMDEMAFFTHCWDLNKAGLIKQGSSNMSVEYQVVEELSHKATMNFYPRFHEGKIVEMPVRMVYNGWAPWNKEMSAKALSKDVLQWYSKVYGKDFITVKHPERGNAFVRVDGNRRITIFAEDDMSVWAIFTDLSADWERIEQNPMRMPVDMNPQTADTLSHE